MTAEFRVGDVFERLAEIPDGTVDLVLTSPPFLALRSYLPDGHPDKAKEIGSEATPAEFLDTLLQLTAEWGRVLAPHGSIAVELGDTFSGSGGAGGDYTDTGWRAGQEKFRAAGNSRPSRWSHTDAHWLAALIDAEGAIFVGVDDRDKNRRTTPSVAVGMNGRTMLDRAASITGVGTVTAKAKGFYWQASGQQARYVLTNIWPYLMVKQPQAKAAIELARHIEECRFGRGRPVTQEALEYRALIRRFIMNLNEKGGNHGRYPNDWDPPTPPRIRHNLTGCGTDWPLPKSLCGIPQLYGVCLAYGVNVLTGEPSPAGKWIVRNLKPWIRSNPPVGALGDKERPATSYVIVATKARDRYFDLDAVRTAPAPANRRTAKGVDQIPRNGKSADRDGNWASLPEQAESSGAPPRDWWHHVDAVLDACLEEMAAKRAAPDRTHEGPQEYSPGGQPTRQTLRTEAPPGARGVHLRRALERAGILATLEAVDVSPKGYAGAHYAVWPPELVRLLVDEMCPRRVCAECGQPSRRIVAAEHHGSAKVGKASAGRPGGGDSGNPDKPRFTTTTTTTLGWSDCGCPGEDRWRPGLVLDPFVGSGTTLAVCTGMARDSIGLDLDERNADLARERVGMFLDIDYGKAADSA